MKFEMTKSNQKLFIEVYQYKNRLMKFKWANEVKIVVIKVLNGPMKFKMAKSN